MTKIILYGVEIEFDNGKEYLSIKDSRYNVMNGNIGRYSLTLPVLRHSVTYLDKRDFKDRKIRSELSNIEELLTNGFFKIGDTTIWLVDPIDGIDETEKYNNTVELYTRILERLDD